MARVSDDKNVQPGKPKVDYLRVQSMHRTKSGWKVTYDKVIKDERKSE